MIEGYYVMIADYLPEVFRLVGVRITPDPLHIKWAIKTLIEQGVATKEDIKLAAIRENNVIIRDDLFPGKEENND